MSSWFHIWLMALIYIVIVLIITCYQILERSLEEEVIDVIGTEKLWGPLRSAAPTKLTTDVSLISGNKFHSQSRQNIFSAWGITIFVILARII